MKFAPFLALLILSACGADGEPTKPTMTTKPGITISGEAQIGIATDS